MVLGILEMVMIGVVLLVILMVGYLVLESTVLYPHDFNLKLMTGGTPIVIRTRAKELKTATGISGWQLLYKKLQVPVPDASVRSITKKGKFYVEGWYFSDGQVQFEKNEKVKDIKYEEIASPVSTEMLTTEQRIMLTNQFKRAEIERGKNVKDLLFQIAMPLGMALILAGVCIFGMIQWSDINKPGLQFAERMVALEREDTKQLQILQEISNDVQLIKTKAAITSNDKVEEKKPPN